MNNGLKDIITCLFKENKAECLTQAIKLIQYILNQGENEISEYFSWFKKMPASFRQNAIKRTKNMIDEAIRKERWRDDSGEELEEHMKILAAIIVSQSQYHYDTLHELRNKGKFIEEIGKLFDLSSGDSQKKICKYAENLYLPGQRKRNTAPKLAPKHKDEDYRYVDNLDKLKYQKIIFERFSKKKREEKKKASKGSNEDKVVKDYDVKKIWHYGRNIPEPKDKEARRTNIVIKIENIVNKIFKDVNHIAVHRQQRNILDRFFLDEIKKFADLLEKKRKNDLGVVKMGDDYNPVIRDYLWGLGDKSRKIVLRKIEIEKENVFLFEPYLGEADFYDKLEDVRDFPGINSDINFNSLSSYYKELERKGEADSNSITGDNRRMILKMVEAIVSSTFKTKKFNFDSNKKISYYDYYYLPYPVIRYIFNYFSCFDVNNEFFLTIEFKREDFQGIKEGDLWVSIPNIKKVKEIFKEKFDKNSTIVTTIIKLLKSIAYRYIVFTISLMAVSVGFKNLLINIKEGNKDIQLDESGYEDDCLTTISEKIGCRPLYTKYISDFQYKPSQVKLRSTVSKVKLEVPFMNLEKEESDLFIGIDIGGSKIKVRSFKCKGKNLEEMEGSFFSFKTFGANGDNDFYNSAGDFIKYIADKISTKYTDTVKDKLWENVYVGISFPGPVFDNQLAGISGVVRRLDKDLKCIQPERQILDSHIDIIQNKVKIVEPIKERLKETLSKLNVSYKNIFVNMTNDGTAEGLGNLHKFFEKKPIKDVEFDYIIVLKAGTGTAGAVLKREKEREKNYFVLEEGPCEFGKLVVNIMRWPRSFEINDTDRISSYILGEGDGGWPGINDYISQRGLNHLLKVLNNEEMFGKMENLSSEEIGKMIESTDTKNAPYQQQAREAAKRLGYIIADTLTTIKIIYKISDDANVGLILSGGVLPRKERATGDFVIEGVKKRLREVHGILLSEPNHGENKEAENSQDAYEIKYRKWSLLKVPYDERELGCRGSAIYSLLKENIKNGEK